MQSLILPALFWQFSLTSQRGRYALNFWLPWFTRVQRSHAQRKLRLTRFYGSPKPSMPLRKLDHLCQKSVVSGTRINVDLWNTWKTGVSVVGL